MTPDEIFLATLDDLRSRCRLNASDYDMVQAAGLLRRLLIDGTSLWTRVNREQRLHISYRWSRIRVPYPCASGKTAWLPGLWMDPVLAGLLAVDSKHAVHMAALAGIGDQVGDFEAFLKNPALVCDGSTVTVREIIKHLAVKEGGVHYEETPAKNTVLEDIRQYSSEPLRLTVLAASRIVVRALEPAEAAIILGDRPHPLGLELASGLSFAETNKKRHEVGHPPLKRMRDYDA